MSSKQRKSGAGQNENIGFEPMKSIFTEYRVIHYANFRSNRTPHHLYILLKQGEPGMCFNTKGGFDLPTDLIFLT